MDKSKYYQKFGYDIWIYPYKKMSIRHMKPETIIRGFLYRKKLIDRYSYFINFGFFKVSIAKAIPVDTISKYIDNLKQENDRRLDIAIARSIYKQSERLVSMLPKSCFTCDDHNRCAKEQEGAEICESYTHTIIE